jgi:hypothetical protein
MCVMLNRNHEVASLKEDYNMLRITSMRLCYLQRVGFFFLLTILVCCY